MNVVGRFVTGYAARRIVGFLPVLIIGSVLVWLMIFLVPGDPALSKLGPDASPVQIAAERHAMGLDRSVFVQYAIWLRDVFHGDLGRSLVNGAAATSLIGNALPVTLDLAVSGLVLSLVVGTLFGVLAALRPDSLLARLVYSFSSLALATPTFWVGMLLVWLFSIYLHVLPSSGYVSLLSDPSGFARHMTLPAVTLGFYGAGIVARFVFAAMRDVLGQDYLWTARAKGLSETRVIWKHGVRNALIPVVTVVGLQFGLLVGGAVIVESVFNLPGMGRLLLNSVESRDYPIVQAEVLIILVAVATANLVVDLLYGVLDPRIRR